MHMQSRLVSVQGVINRCMCNADLLSVLGQLNGAKNARHWAGFYSYSDLIMHERLTSSAFNSVTMSNLQNKVNITNKRDWEQKKNNKGRVTDRYYSNSILTWFTLGHRWRRDSALTHARGNPKTRSTPALPNLPACSQRIIPHQAVCFISSSQLLQYIILLFQFTLLIV